ncbi:hypothetical protein [Rhizobium sp. MHM7A]|uniref:hypothetical protein n=1 Tax=Rhizobium sp. MHM7A TaxID=2583233 RepID=UPI0011067D4A|nr:hypothetical protein [Rhizobium sp. MHM7A]TLX16140.1 hypothetical protein FFR93_02105 [Rhizobium sp. MHM7A]
MPLFEALAGRASTPLKALPVPSLAMTKVTLIVTNESLDRETIRHEFIHCAQVYASQETMSACLAAAEAIGRQIVVAVRAAIEIDPTLETKGHRDLLRLTTAWQFVKEQGANAVPPPHALFDDLHSYYPTPDTRSLSASLGFGDPDCVYAAMTAAILKEIDFSIEPTSDLAREIVAHAFQATEHASVDSLFAEATERAETLAEELRAEVALRR